MGMKIEPAVFIAHNRPLAEHELQANINAFAKQHGISLERSRPFIQLGNPEEYKSRFRTRWKKWWFLAVVYAGVPLACIWVRSWVEYYCPAALALPVVAVNPAATDSRQPL